MRTSPALNPWRPAAAAAFALAIAASSACNLQIGTGIEARDEWARSYTVSPGATLEVRETNGKIRVEAASGDTIEVRATRIAKSQTEEAAQAALKDFTIKETAGADRVELDSSQSGIQHALHPSIRVDYEIKVPRSINVTIKTTNGSVDVLGIAGALRIDGVNGRVSATGLGSSAEVSTVNGQLNLEFVSLGEAGVRCKTMNGQIVVTIPAASKATIAARVVNGVVRAENLALQASEDSRRRLEATVGGGGPEIRLETTNGEIRIVGK